MPLNIICGDLHRTMRDDRLTFAMDERGIYELVIPDTAPAVKEEQNLWNSNWSDSELSDNDVEDSDHSPVASTSSDTEKDKDIKDDAGEIESRFHKGCQ